MEKYLLIFGSHFGVFTRRIRFHRLSWNTLKTLALSRIVVEKVENTTKFGTCSESSLPIQESNNETQEGRNIIRNRESEGSDERTRSDDYCFLLVFRAFALLTKSVHKFIRDQQC